MKAFLCRNDEERISTIVFAETAGKARYIAIKSDDLGDDLNFMDVSVLRVPELDGAYKGKSIMDWDDPEDRVLMVKNGFICYEDTWEESDCVSCPAKQYCGGHNH